MANGNGEKGAGVPAPNPTPSPPAPPVQSSPPPSPPDPPAAETPKTESEGGSMSAVDQVHARMAEAREAEAEAQRELNERTARQREAAHRDYVESEAGQVHYQAEEAERIMRLPTPEAHKALGTPPSDPLKGPSS